MNSCEKYAINQCEPMNYCSNTNDYRPIQSSLLTRFTTTNRSELWRTTNQDYGAFYYHQLPHSCTPDSLKAKIYRRQNRFQDWLQYQNLARSCKTKSNNNNNNNNNNNHNIQNIISSDRNDTVRITHRKKFLSECNDNVYPNQQSQNHFLPCGEDGLIIEYIVKQILDKLKCLFKSDEYHDVAACAQLLVSDILTQEPCLLADEVIDRVLRIMITPPNNIDNTCFNPCYPCYPCNITKPICCPSPDLTTSYGNHNQMLQQTSTVNNELPFCATMNNSIPSINYNQTTTLSNVFEKLTHLEV